ncbi:MAG: hypothetical protein PWR20_1044 [Bacteroidales bacterium]|nr:hypothetical protein [Bacteroidales bacterium]MDN5328278.1 hypothetical protein [Bacteroidales bacterium]
MAQTNNATLLRRDLLTRLCRLMLEDNLENIDRIPVEMMPRTGKAASRCCPYKGRAILRYRIMSLLGYNVADETDELESLYNYALRALSGFDKGYGVLTVVDEACDGCVKSNYTVSNLCRGCLASHCMVSCPKGAIRMVDGKAHIDESLCIGCGKCQQACPYHAIIYVPIPCEESCPVGAIKRGPDGKEHIDPEKCIHCGRCMTACPFGAIMYRSQIIHVLYEIKNQARPLVALVAPAIAGQFRAGFSQVRSALLKIGFSAVEQVAEGAAQTARNEAEEWIHKNAGGQPVMTTSCCPAFVSLAEKHLPNLRPLVSDTPSPMVYSAMKAREKYPEAGIVFVGPCVAKQAEARKHGSLIDYVMTFEELGALLIARGIDVVNEPDSSGKIPLPETRFAMSGGVAASVQTYLPEGVDFPHVVVDGLNRKNVALLKTLPKNKNIKGLVEVMACEGGCLAGPGALTSTETAQKLFKENVPLPEKQWAP